MVWGPGALLPLHKRLKLAEVGQRSLRAFRRERKVGGDFDYFYLASLQDASGRLLENELPRSRASQRRVHAQPRTATRIYPRLCVTHTCSHYPRQAQAPVTCCRASQRWSARSPPDAHGTPEAKPWGCPVCTHCTTWVKFTDSAVTRTLIVENPKSPGVTSQVGSLRSGQQGVFY